MAIFLRGVEGVDNVLAGRGRCGRRSPSAGFLPLDNAGVNGAPASPCIHPAPGRLLLCDDAWIGYVDLVPVVIAFGEEPVIPQLRETVTEGTVSADASRMMSPGSEEAVLPQYRFEFSDRRATVHRGNIGPEEGEAVPDECINRLHVPARRVQVDNDSLRQFDWLSPAEDDVAYGSAAAVRDKTTVRRLRAVDEPPIQESRVAREDHGVFLPRPVPEFVDLGAEAIDLGNMGGSRLDSRPRHEVARPKQRVGEPRKEAMELEYVAGDACRSVGPAMVSRAQ